MVAIQNLSLISVAILVLYVQFSDANTFRLAGSYQDHMVLQRAPNNARLWGYGEVNAFISLTFNGKVYSTTASRVDWTTEAVWKIVLDPTFATNVPVNLQITQVTQSGAISTIQLNDVLFGDVWVCGGQSNMDWPLVSAMNGQNEVNRFSSFPNGNIQIAWSAPTQSSLPFFSATCWYFGREINQKLNVPIGLIQSCVGGTEIEKWMSSELLGQTGTPRRPAADSKLWNAMMSPLIVQSIYGVIWYQGESNAWINPQFYIRNFPEMINDWRRRWFAATDGSTNPSFPFGFVQVANYATETQSIGDFPWLRVRQTALFGYAPNPLMQNVFMASAVDLVDNYQDPIHPRFKEDVGLRLSIGALNLAYQQPIEFSAPRVASVTYNFPIVSVNFATIPENLGTVNLRINSDSGFEICCDSAQCLIDQDTNWQSLIGINMVGSVAAFTKPLSCQEPQAVRYLWRQKPCEFKACPLYTVSSNLPVTPFISLVLRSQ